MKMPGAPDDDDDFAATVREAVALFDARDPARQRFGARRHQYRFRAPLEAARVAALEAAADVRLPDDYRAHVTRLGDGGAGPYHGLTPLDRDAQRALLPGRFDAADPFHGVVGLGHLGCGYLALLVVDEASPARGQVWIDARGAGAGVIAGYPSFRHYVADWIARLAHAEWLPSFVPPGACALPAALSAYFRGIEEQRGLAEGSLAGPDLRAALDQIPDGGIATAHDGANPFFAAGDPIDLCVACERLSDNLGLRRTTVRPGLAPIPERE
jgi:hypothetical protein